MHFFDEDLAIKYGVDGAIFLGHLCFWIRKNKANEKNFFDGYYWTYNSIKAYKELFPYWTTRQLERIINNLENKKALKMENYNQKKYDRTKWYTVIDKDALRIYKIDGEETQETQPVDQKARPLNKELTAISRNGEMDFTKRGNGFLEMVKPIPDNKPDKKTDKEKSEKVKTFPDNSQPVILSKTLLEYNRKNLNGKGKFSKTDPNFQKWAYHIDLMNRKDNYTFEEIREMIEFSQNHYFYKTIIQSTDNLRDKGNTIYMAMNENKNKYNSAASKPENIPEKTTPNLN